MNLPSDTITAILLGANYIAEGNPLKDAMDAGEIEDAIVYLADLLEQEGYKLDDSYYEDE
jgi:hypothetical protein